MLEPETAHAVRAAIDEALRCKEQNKEECIVISLSGHGQFDLAAYDAYFEKRLQDLERPQEAIDETLKHIPEVDA